MVVEDAIRVYEGKEERFGAEAMSEMADWVLLRTIDSKWREHLYEMDYLREGIGLRALAQRDPLIEYKNEGFQLFQAMMESIQTDFVRYVYHLEIVKEEEPAAAPARQLNYSGGGDTGLQQNFAGTAAAARRSGVADSSGEAYDAAQAAAKNGGGAQERRPPRWAGTTPARAAAARSTRSAAAPKPADASWLVGYNPPCIWLRRLRARLPPWPNIASFWASIREKLLWAREYL